jgi:uncharacterized protein YecA (UPF0149 family)
MSRKKDGFKNRRVMPGISPRGHMFPKEPVVSDKVPRNSVCPCGSGLKYKNCCKKGSRSFFQRIIDYIKGKE